MQVGGSIMKTLLLGLLLLPLIVSAEPRPNGFDLRGALVPVEEIHQGGPPRDGIPALHHPKYARARETRYLDRDDLVLGLVSENEARAYPTRVLVWHEIVNTEFSGEPVVVTFCPLCGTGLAFFRRQDGRTLRFGVSGLLYNSDMLMYDLQSESLWSQIPGKAVSGEFAGKQLARVAVVHMRWEAWRERYPESLVLSDKTGYRRDYDRNPYSGYEDSEHLYFSVARESVRLPRKAWVVGLERDGKARAWPLSALQAAGTIRDEFAGQALTLRYEPDSGAVYVENDEGEQLTPMRAYWFAWYAFYPFTEVYDG